MEELIKLMQEALSMEHAAAIQYGAHAEQITGLYAEPVMARLKDSQHDEEKHADTLRGLIGDYLEAIPTMDIAPTFMATGINGIIDTNITTEKEAIDKYQRILNYLDNNKERLSAIYLKVHHDIRHIAMEEMEHIAELERIK